MSYRPQVFYATIGASANVALVLHTAPILFAYSFVAIAGHLGLLLVVGTALGFSRRDLLLASNANIGGEGLGEARGLAWVVRLALGFRRRDSPLLASNANIVGEGEVAVIDNTRGARGGTRWWGRR